MSASRLAFRPGGLFCFCFVLLSFLTATTLSAREIQVSGRAYVDLGTVAQRFGMQGYWLAGYETYRLKSRWTTIDAGKNAKTLQVNRLPVYLGSRAVVYRKG
jgi:hypothetical protein